ncbi:MAG: methyltransferase domain-containing protein [Candidatus Moraniibacteriota bacterium]|nr:MAG: methyltransferase domain-containing protein [Candidatus Moranbacteria bacterium]
MSLKPFIKVPLVLVENIIFSFFPSSRKFIERIVFNPYSFGFNHLEYAKKQFDSFLLKISPTQVRDKIILELGPGGSVGFGLLALKSGAKRYYAIENGDHTKIDSKIFKAYKKLLNNNVHLISEFFTKNFHFNRKKICFIENDQISPYNISDNSIDIIYSCAVLEHVHNLDFCFSEMTRVLKNGGIMNHQVDLRDHIFSQRSIWFLKISDRIFNALFSKTGEYVNRKRFSYYIDLIRKNNLQIVNVEKNILFNGELDQNLLKRYTEDDLRTLSMNITLKKSCA